MANPTDSDHSSEQESGKQDPPRPRTRQFSQDDITRKIEKFPDTSYRRGEVRAADFSRSVDDFREFKEALEQETDIPAMDAASRDDDHSQPQGKLSNGKKRIPGLTILILGLFFGLLVVAEALLTLGKSFFTPKIPLTATQPASQGLPISGPQAGSLMAFGDGSVHIFVPDPNGLDNNGKKGFWITLNPISNYQFSLCVQAGSCQPPATEDFKDPAKGNLPADIHGDGLSAYCGWIGGRIPTDAEQTAFKNLLQSFNTGGETDIQDDTVRGLGDGSVHNFDAGVHCVVDRPLPLPRFVKTSPYYDPNVAVEDTTPEVLQTGEFCQSGQAFQTIDLKLDEDASIASIDGGGKTNCQLVNGNRVVCYGAPDTNPQVTVGLLSNGYEGARCEIGSEFDGDGCVVRYGSGGGEGMDDWEYNANGVLVPVHGVRPPGVQPANSQNQPLFTKQLPNGSLLGPVLQHYKIINGVMVARDLIIILTDPTSTPWVGAYSYLCWQGYQLDQACFDYAIANGRPIGQCPCVPVVTPTPTPTPAPLIYVLVGGGDTADPNSTTDTTSSFATNCPAGYYLDVGVEACISLGPPQNRCLSGYHFNAERHGCEADQPNANYPGCPLSQLLNPLTGQCDAKSSMISTTSVVMYEPLQISLPECTTDGSGSESGSGPSSGGGPGGPSCPAGYTYTCDPVCGCAPP